MKNFIFLFIFCFYYSKSYSQKIEFPLEKYNNDSIIYSLTNKVLSEINNKWEKNSQGGHTIEAFKGTSTVGDSTISLSVIIPSYKCIVTVNQLSKKYITYSIALDNPLDFYIKPIPFTNKIYSYSVEDVYHHKHEEVSMLGSASANFITQALEIDTAYKTLFLGYFLDRDRYWDNFLVKKNNKNELLIIDRQLKIHHGIEDFINNKYSSIQNLSSFINEGGGSPQKRLIFYLVDNTPHISDGDDSWVLNNANIDSLEMLSFSDDRVKGYKDLWKYDQLVYVKTKPATKSFTLTEFYNHYNIKKKDNKLKICVDKKLLKYPQNLLIDSSAILKVELIKGKYFIETSLGKTLYDTKTKTYYSTTKTIIDSKEKFINIVTKAPQSNEANK